MVRTTQNFDRLSLHSLKNYLKEYKIIINIEIEIDPFATSDEIIATGQLNNLKNKARSNKKKNNNFLFFIIVIIVEMGMDLHASRNFMLAVLKQKMKTSEYVYINPWLAHVYYIIFFIFKIKYFFRCLIIIHGKHLEWIKWKHVKHMKILLL